MNVLGIRITVGVISIVLMILSVILILKRKLDNRFFMVLFGIVCFAFSGLHLIYVYGFSRSIESDFHIISFFGVVAGLILGGAGVFVTTRLLKKQKEYEASAK